MNPINIFIVTGEVTITNNLATTFQNPLGGKQSVCMVWMWPTDNFLTHPKKCSGSIYADPINMIHTSQQATKYGLGKEIEGDYNLYQYNCSSRY